MESPVVASQLEAEKRKLAQATASEKSGAEVSPKVKRRTMSFTAVSRNFTVKVVAALVAVAMSLAASCSHPRRTRVLIQTVIDCAQAVSGIHTTGGFSTARFSRQL